MNTAISTMTAEKMKRLLLKEMEALDSGLVIQNVGSGLRIKALWNISRHKLYEAEGYQNMKTFSEKTGYSYRWVKALIEQGDIMASVLFSADTPEEVRWLTAEHVKQFVAAKCEANLLAKNDILQIEGSNSQGIMSTEDEDVKAIAKKLAKLKRDAKKNDKGEGEGEPAPMPPKSQAFVDKYFRKRVNVSNLLTAAFNGDEEMLAEYNTFIWDDQWPILAAARERILSIPKLG